MSISPHSSVALIVALTLSSGCTTLPHAQPSDSRVDFAAHPGYRGLVVDRMEGGHTAVLVRAHAGSVGPTHLFEADDKTVAALWVEDSDRVTVRQAPETTAAMVGDVTASWKEGAIRLAFHSANGDSFSTSRFNRIEGAPFRNVLDREMYAIRDLPGIYRAELRDGHDVPVGWVRVRILPYQGLPRDYQADVPAPLDGPLAAGAVALLDSEIAKIIALNAFPDDRMPEGLVP